MDLLYLDHNATSPLLPEVAEALDRAHRAGYANPAGQHTAGRKARQALEDARERIGELLGAAVSSHRADRVIFTSGGTEANNLALFGLSAKGRELLLSAVEHPSVRGPAAELARRGTLVDTIPVDRQGRIDAALLGGRLRPVTQLVSLQMGNSETGVIQPVAETATVCRTRNVLIHTDAAQAVGRVDVNFTRLGVDALSATAHKFHGPLGIGVLVVRRGVVLNPVSFGGFQQGGLRPGTESVALVVGLAAALEIAVRDRAARANRWTALRDDFESRLRAGCAELVVHGAEAERLPQTSNVAFLGVDRQVLLMALDQAGIACSTGTACASGSSEPSPTLTAMGCSTAELQSSLRFSFGALTTAAQAAEAADRILKVYRELRHGEERRKMAAQGR